MRLCVGVVGSSEFTSKVSYEIDIPSVTFGKSFAKELNQISPQDWTRADFVFLRRRVANNETNNDIGSDMTQIFTSIGTLKYWLMIMATVALRRIMIYDRVASLCCG